MIQTNNNEQQRILKYSKQKRYQIMRNRSKTKCESFLKNCIFFAVFLLIIFDQCYCFNFKQLGRSTVSRTINQRTSYTFIFDRSITNTGQATTWSIQPVPSNANVSVQFPNQFLLTGAQLCDKIQIVSATQLYSPTGFTCTVEGNKVIFANALVAIGDLMVKTVTVTYNNVLNPSPALRTKQFTGYLGVDVAVPNAGTFIQLIAATFIACQLNFGNGGYVNKTSPAIFSIIPLNQLNSTSTLRITFPMGKVWENDISTTNQLPIVTGVMGCSPLLNVGSNIACLGNYNAFTVSASSLFSTVLTSGTKFSFQINTFFSPPTLQDSDVIKITSLTNNFQVDTCSIKVTGLKPKQFNQLKIAPVGGTMKVNQKVGVFINMTFSDTVDEKDTFRVTFPESISISYTSISTMGNGQPISSLNGQVLSIAMNPDFTATYWQDQFFVIIFYTMTAPSSIKESDSITVQVLRNGYQKMISTTTVQATKSTLEGTITPQSLLVNNNTLYVFSIKLNDKLSSSGWFQITFPQDVVLPDTITSIIVTGSGMKSQPLASVSKVQNKVTIKQLNSSSAIIPNQTFTLILGQIKNPGTTKPTQQFGIITYYQTGTQYLVATGTISGITPTSGTLKSTGIAITKSSDIVLASSVEYKYSFLTTYDIPQNGIVKLVIPNDIRMDLTNLQTNCFQQINSTGTKTAATCSGTLNLTSNKYQVTVKSLSLSDKLPGNSTIAITFQNICTNPDTTRNIIGFSIIIQSFQGYLIQSAITGVSVRAGTPALCLNVNVNRLSKKNSQLTNYTVSFRQLSNLQAESYLVLGIPTQMYLTASTYCTDLMGTINLTYTTSANVLTIKLSSNAIANMTSFGVTLTNVLNIGSFQPLSQPFTLLTKTPDNINKYCQSSTTVLIQNDVPSAFSQISGVFTQRMFYQITELIVNFKPSDKVIPGYLVVSLAAQLKVQTLTCSFQGISAGACAQTTPNTIKITGSLTTNQMQFTISGIRTPVNKQILSQFSSVSSFTLANYKVDESVNLIEFKIKCDLPCKTCDDSNSSMCLSCYHNLSISTQMYYHSVGKKCYSICPDGFYEETLSLKCQPCNTLCKNCQVSATNCTSCVTNSSSPYFNLTSANSGTCLNLCPTLYYPSPLGLCVLCQSPCKACTSKTICLSCLSGFYMYNDTCRSSCPVDITISNPTTSQCDNCSTVCATCTGNINNCLTCSLNAAFYNNSCVAICPPPLVIKQGICTTCDSICKECSINSNNCTKCDSTSLNAFLFNYTCLANCPQTNYKNVIGGNCKLCQSLNIGCKNCSSMSTCYTCDTGFILLNNKCLNVTPTGYYNQNGIAQPCAGDCATCIDFAIKCQSCKTLNLHENECVSTCPLNKVPQNKVCIPCQSPCLTCSNLKTNCTSCVPNLTPDVFLNNFYCTSLCPQYTYANETTNLCVLCKQPCLKCIGETQCLTCINGRFLLGSHCIQTCPDNYIGINKICQPCQSPCETCETTTTRCRTCKNGFYFYNSSAPTCVADCTVVGLYPDVQAQKCTGCKPPCITCVNTSTTCTSCSQSIFLFQNKCLSTCPQGYYPFSSSCRQCPSECATCTSQSTCQTCNSMNYLYLNYCLSQCPQGYPVVNQGKCNKCSDQVCGICTQNDYCIKCQNPYYLHLGKCTQSCPVNYTGEEDNSTSTRECRYNPPNSTQPTDNKTEQAIVQTLKSRSGGNLFPVPFSIAAAFIGIATIMSKFQNPFTFIPGVLYSLWGLLEWGAVGVMLWFFYQQNGWQKIQFYIMAGSIAFLYLLNLIAFIVQNVYLMGDTNFKKWLNFGSNRCFYYACSIVGFLATHKFKHFMFSKMFNFASLKARLDSTQQFRVFNAFSFLSFLSSAGILFGLGLTFATYQVALDQGLMAYVDATVLTSINIILAILNSRKSQDFFEQKTEQGYIVNKRIQDSDQLLYGGLLPSLSEQKVEHNQTTGKKLVSAYQTAYRNLNSQVSQQSFRGIDISVQAQPILGEQSRITHLNSEAASQLNLFQYKDVSMQFDQLTPDMHDKSCNMSYHQKHQISMQMDHVSQNQISVQVQRQNREVSVQYAPNLLDRQVGMSRQQVNISIQANPFHEDISIQYSAKPVFVHEDREYNESVDQQQLIESHELQVSQIKPNQQRNDQSLPSQSANQNYLGNGIKRPDDKLKAQLQIDIDQRLKQRQAQLLQLQEQRKRQQRKQIIISFQNKQHQQQQQFINQNKQRQNRQNNHQTNNQMNKLYNNQDTSKEDPSQSIMDSKYDILNNRNQSIMDSQYDILNNKNKHQFQSSQSQVRIRAQTQNDLQSQQHRGQKSFQQIIQMLSGHKTLTNQNQDTLQAQRQQLQYGNKALKVQYNNQLQESNLISLNMTEEIQQNENKNTRDKDIKPARFNFQSRNIEYDNSSQQQQENIDDHPVRAQLSNQYTKSISTRHVTTLNNNRRGQQQQQSASHLGRGSVVDDDSRYVDSSLNNSQNQPAQHINDSPIKPLANNRGNFMRVNDGRQDSKQVVPKTNLTQFLQNKGRNLKSATITGRGHQRNERFEQLDGSVGNQDEQYQAQQQQKQQPLPLPRNQFQGFDEDYMEDLQFGQSQKVVISPFQTEEFSVRPLQSRRLPTGINLKQSKNNRNSQNGRSNSQKKQLPTNIHYQKRQKPVHNQLLNPSTAHKSQNLDLKKQLQKQQKKFLNRKKELQLMEGMLQRPSQSKKGYSKDDQQKGKSSVEKVYLNRKNGL